MHSSKNIEHLWKSEWGHDMYVAHGSNESRGTGTVNQQIFACY